LFGGAGPAGSEEIIVQHPALREAAVFGIPSEKWGETPLAALILRQSGTITAEQLCAWINERVDAKNQRAHAVAVMEDFTQHRQETLRRVLSEPYWARREEKM
jgi:long-chain acyl-CoA synthetase